MNGADIDYTPFEKMQSRMCFENEKTLVFGYFDSHKNPYRNRWFVRSMSNDENARKYFSSVPKTCSVRHKEFSRADHTCTADDTLLVSSSQPSPVSVNQDENAGSRGPDISSRTAEEQAGLNLPELSKDKG